MNRTIFKNTHSQLNPENDERNGSLQQQIGKQYGKGIDRVCRLDDTIVVGAINKIILILETK